MAEILSTISLVSFALSGICFALSVFLWFHFGIGGVIGDLSGRTAKKSIQKMREHNEKKGPVLYDSGMAGIGQGRFENVMTSVETAGIENFKTNLNSMNEMPETGILLDNEETELLSQSSEVLNRGAKTTLLNDEETVSLKNSVQVPEVKEKGISLTMLDDIMLVHTDEVI